MGLLDDISKTFIDVGQKGKDMSEVARLNSLVTQTENQINDLYGQIGKRYVSIHGADGEEEFADMIKILTELEQQCVIYKKQIQDIKNIQCCEKCGAELLRDSLYCSVCGHPVSKQKERDADDRSMRCSKCKTRLEEGMNFCTVCGTPVKRAEFSEADEVLPDLPQMEREEINPHKVCPNCGAEQSDDAIFCTECATKL